MDESKWASFGQSVVVGFEFCVSIAGHSIYSVL